MPKGKKKKPLKIKAPIKKMATPKFKRSGKITLPKPKKKKK